MIIKYLIYKSSLIYNSSLYVYILTILVGWIRVKGGSGISVSWHKHLSYWVFCLCVKSPCVIHKQKNQLKNSLCKRSTQNLRGCFPDRDHAKEEENQPGNYKPFWNKGVVLKRSLKETWKSVRAGRYFVMETGRDLILPQVLPSTS